MVRVVLLAVNILSCKPRDHSHVFRSLDVQELARNPGASVRDPRKQSSRPWDTILNVLDSGARARRLGYTKAHAPVIR
jgi:hypothetical protein